MTVLVRVHRESAEHCPLIGCSEGFAIGDGGKHGVCVVDSYSISTREGDATPPVDGSQTVTMASVFFFAVPCAGKATIKARSGLEQIPQVAQLTLS